MKLTAALLATRTETADMPGKFHDVAGLRHNDRRGFFQSILDSVAANIAVIDTSGVIVAVNQPWLRFSDENNLDKPHDIIGQNYLTACLGAGTDAGGREVYEGIRAVLNTSITRFSHEYPCHSPDQQRWFEVSVTPLGKNAKHGAVILHTDITERHTMQLELSNYAANQKIEALKLRSAVDNLRALIANSESTLIAERKRIAYELHDELGQLLAALRIDLSLLKTECHTRAPQLVPKAIDMIQLINRAIASMRGIVVNLRPIVIDSGLVSALDWLKNDFINMFKIECILNYSDHLPVISEVQLTAVFSITQELLTNAAKHSKAQHVTINLSCDLDQFQLSVQDNGIGFEPNNASKKPDCFGLRGMNERMRALGGALMIKSEKGLGSCVTLILPLTSLQPSGCGIIATQTEPTCAENIDTVGLKPHAPQSPALAGF
ncbi:MAG: histidine kinase [Nitrosomonadales bacterium]